MALGFKVEALPEKVVIHVKGNVIELSYHAASCLCRNIIEECERRNIGNLNKYRYWVDRFRHRRKVTPNESNKEEYEKFLATMGNSEDLRPSKKGERGGRRKKERANPRLTREAKEEERRAAMRAKIRELQERHHITPKKRENDDENS